MYFIAFIVLFAFLSLYIFLGRRLNIIDKPNERSSHNYITVRGGGTVFWAGSFLSYLFDPSIGILFLTGLTLVSSISLLDDILKLHSFIRFFFQLLGISLLYIQFRYPIEPNLWMIILGSIVSIGILNSFNFMDGINGITGLYSLSVLLPLQWVNLKLFEFISPVLINITIIAIIVFLFYNYRLKALCFAGDVGSIGIGFIIVFLLLSLIIKTQNIFWLIFLAVYGIDVVLTLIHRLFLKENIFKPHRLHFYQILSNNLKIDHRLVSAGYAVTQLAITLLFYLYSVKLGAVFLTAIILAVLTMIYLSKFWFIKTEKGD